MGSSVGVFREGSPEFCVEEERIARVKNWMGIPTKALAYVLREGFVTPDRVDVVALCNDEFFPISREKFYYKYDMYFKRAHGFDTSREAILDRTKLLIGATPLYSIYKAKKDAAQVSDEAYLRKLGFPQRKIKRVDHHFCHGAAAYYGLAQRLDDEYLVFTLDGGGDSLKSSIWKATHGEMNLLNSSGCYSIGNMFAAVTYFLGFTPHEHEYKLMGLAPYVGEAHRERYRRYFSRFLNLIEGDTQFVNPMPLDHTKFLRFLVRDLARARFDNVAAGLQEFCEQIVVRWIRGGIRKYGVRNVLCSGGVFMNVKMNMLLSRIPEIETIDVFPSCGDESNIFGAAFYLHNSGFEKKVGCLSSYCLGMRPAENLEDTLKGLPASVRVRQVEDPNGFVAEQLVNNRIVARCSGPMEFGARALGNRSILANPRDLGTVNRLNRAIKNRDFWMPFAPAVLGEKASEMIKVPGALAGTGSPYMMFAFETLAERHRDVMCVLHQADFTARAQTVDRQRYPQLHEIISRFYQRTGIPCILNTSFNLHGHPIVATSRDAVDVFLQSDLDVLVIEDHVLEKI